MGVSLAMPDAPPLPLARRPSTVMAAGYDHVRGDWSARSREESNSPPRLDTRRDVPESALRIEYGSASYRESRPRAAGRYLRTVLSPRVTYPSLSHRTGGSIVLPPNTCLGQNAKGEALGGATIDSVAGGTDAPSARPQPTTAVRDAARARSRRSHHHLAGQPTDGGAIARLPAELALWFRCCSATGGGGGGGA